MIVKPDWNIFKVKFSDNPQKNFEWFCYLLFCREFNQQKGIFRYLNQAGIETEPITMNTGKIGWQAKFYDVRLTKRKAQIVKTIESTKEKYPDITKIRFYTNKDWTTNKGKETKAQTDIEEFCKSENILLEWRTASFFESEFVVNTCSDISGYFFQLYTEDERDKFCNNINKLKKHHIDISPDVLYESALLINNGETITGKHVLQNFILKQMQEYEWPEYKNIYVKGIAGIGKSTEMKLAYNAVLDEFSDKENYGKYQFCPVPYFFELKNYQENFFTVRNEDDYFMLFLDGLDELSDSRTMSLVKYLSNLNNQYPNIRFIISGRDASFITEINNLWEHIDIKLSPYVNENDTELRNLILSYKGTPLEDLVKIPFYRNFALSEKAQGLKTYKDFCNVLITTKLEDDKTRRDRAEDISLRSETLSEIDIPHIQEKLMQFCHTLFLQGEWVFTEQELKEAINDTTDSLFIIESSLIDYRDENNISFISNIYFEYFVAQYYSSQKVSVIFKDLFLSTGRVKVRNLNIITVLLNLLPVASGIYKKITERLGHESLAYILLTDYENLTAEERYKYYCGIITEYNSQHKQIYYGRFFPTQEILANIDSLSNKLIGLLPEKYKTRAIGIHIQQIQSFLKNPDENRIVEFSNEVIMLGVYNGKIWNDEQQKELRSVAVPLLHFFLKDTRTQGIKGLLSANMILSWYQVYGWTDDWALVDWNSFVKRFFPDSPDDFYSFVTEDDFRFKLQLFIHFYNNPAIWKLLVPSVIKLLSNNYAVGKESIVPEELDDEYQTPVLQFDNDISYVTQIIKMEPVDVDDLIKIIISVIRQHINLRSLNFQNRNLLDVLLVQVKAHLAELYNDKDGLLYEILKTYIENDSGAYLKNLDQYIGLLPDNVKIDIVKKLYKDLESDNYIKVYYLGTTIYNLLNVSEKKHAEELFEVLRKDTMASLYKNIVWVAHSEKMEGHALFEKAQQLYPVLYANEIQAENIKKERFATFEVQKQAMLEKEYSVITQKDALLNGISKVFDYIDTHSDFSQKEDERGNILDLESAAIERYIKFDYSNDYVSSPVFSEFALKVLFYQSDTGESKINREKIIQNIKKWFSNEKYFWRFFFWLYMCHYSKEERDAFLSDHEDVVVRIKSSLQQEVSELIEDQNIQSYDGGQNSFWVVPFVHYISLLYGNKIPDWFKKDKITNFIAFPAWALATDYSVHTNSEFKWENWNSVFEWIEAVAGIEENILIEKSFEIFPELKSDQSRTQIITLFVNKLNSQPDYPRRKEMLETVISESRKEVNLDYPDSQHFTIMNHGALSDFWRKNKENVTDRIQDWIPFDTYNPKDMNYCRKEVIEYFCSMADALQKKAVINLLKTKSPDENMQILLAKLGDTDTVLSNLEALLSGKELDTSLFFGSLLFGAARGNTKLLKKYIQLFTYSYEKSNDRRQYLSDIARAGIKDTVTKKNFSVLRRQFLRLISLKKKKNEYFEYIHNFLDEVEQSVFSN
jgi:hypothetical protein